MTDIIERRESTNPADFVITMTEGRRETDNDAEKGVYDFLDKIGVNYRTFSHPSAFTMEECEAVRREIGAPVFKNLFLTNRQQTELYLLVMPADKPFKTKYLSSQIGCARLSFANEEMMWEYLKIHPGAVSPMGLVYDTRHKVRLIIDKDLENSDRYACHPCVNTASLEMSYKDLMEKILPATGHDYTYVELKPE